MIVIQEYRFIFRNKKGYIDLVKFWASGFDEAQALFEKHVKCLEESK